MALGNQNEVEAQEYLSLIEKRERPPISRLPSGTVDQGNIFSKET
jgi:hypothetical protein